MLRLFNKGLNFTYQSPTSDDLIVKWRVVEFVGSSIEKCMENIRDYIKRVPVHHWVKF